MTASEIKSALIDGAIVRVVGIDYVDVYHLCISQDGTALTAYFNAEPYPITSLFAEMDGVLSRTNARFFRRSFPDGGVTITAVCSIGEEC